MFLIRTFQFEKKLMTHVSHPHILIAKNKTMNVSHSHNLVLKNEQYHVSHPHILVKNKITNIAYLHIFI